MKLFILSLILFTMNAVGTKAQDTSAVKHSLTISGYAEIYYGYDFNEPENHIRSAFIYAYNRHNEVNLDLGFVKAAYSTNNFRANLALMAGTYTKANLAAEPKVFRHILEANAGLKLSKRANLWLDAGIFASHIGYESAVGKNCWTLTRNIASDNTPYYEAGAKITYITTDNKLTLTGLYVNGWQRIYRPNEYNKPAGGLEMYYTPNAKVTLNYSNYFGSESVNNESVNRFYNNFYGIFQFTQAFGLTTGFDYGIQQKAKSGNRYYHVISPVAVIRYQFAGKWATAARAEYYQDKNSVITATGTPYGLNTMGYSVNVDYAVLKNALIRLEGKVYNSKDNIFFKSGSYVNTNPAITAAFAISF